MASIVSQIVVLLVNRELSDGSGNWPHVSVTGSRLLSYQKKHVVEDDVLFTNHLVGK